PLHSVSSVSASCLLPLSFCSARARSAISTFSLHDALPICYYEFRVLSIDEREQRVRIEAEVVHTGRLRDFFGFNRAKHAVVEAADRKSTRLNSSHQINSYAVFCVKKKNTTTLDKVPKSTSI